jgi:hypothetical protein
VKGILADINIQSYVDLLAARMRSEPWKIFWDYLHLQYFHFSDVGLAQEALDSLVWETCQNNQLVLLTDNRNQADPDSLEATIRKRNTPASLPVFTIANVPHLRKSREYGEKIIEKLFVSLLDIENLRGTGRLFLP